MGRMSVRKIAFALVLIAGVFGASACDARHAADNTVVDVAGAHGAMAGGDIKQSGGGGAWKAIADTLAGAQLFGITAGPDGNLWFTDYNRSAIGRVDMSGNLTEFPTPTQPSNPYAITVGPDGALWFTEQGAKQLGRITTAGKFTEFSTVIKGVGYNPGDGIVAGPDGNLWFTVGGSTTLIRASTSGGMTAFANPFNCVLARITRGSDGNLWATGSCFAIERIKSDGTFTYYPLPNNAQGWDIVSASDGALYFSEPADHNLGKITPSGVVTLLTSPDFVLPGRGLLAVGNQVWFVVEGTDLNEIGRLDVPSDTFAAPLHPGPAPLHACCTWYFANAPDGNVYFTTDNANVGVYIARAMKLAPRSATISAGGTVTITVSEKKYTGGWTAVSSKPSVATVAPGGSSDQFVVTGHATGACKITINDDSGNSVAAPVTVM